MIQLPNLSRAMPCADCFGFLGTFSKPSEPSLRILTANDVYKPERFAVLRSLCKRQKSNCSAPTKFVLPGDLLGGSLFANVHRGESVIDLLNAVEVDYCVLGNHEFDFGADRTKELMSKSQFPWLGSNVRELINGERPIFHNTMDYDFFPIQVGSKEVKVGVFGVCTAATPQLSAPGKFVAFDQPHEHAQRCVSILREQHGCEFIIALTHLSLINDKHLAEWCPGINVILGGHDHDPFFLIHRGVLIAKCGQNADHLGVLDLYMDFGGPDKSLRVDHSFQLLTTSKTPADKAVSKLVQRWTSTNEADESLCVVAEKELSSRTHELRAKENSFGSLVADAMLWRYSAETCQLALINGGCVRADRSYPVGHVLTKAEVEEEMPFDGKVALQKLSGEQLLRGLEEMLSQCPAPSSSFPHISRNAHLRYSPAAPALAKVRSFQINDCEVDPQREYLVAVSEFYINSAGDGVSSFHGVPVLKMHDEFIREVVVSYLRTLEEVSGALGRMEAM